MESGFFNIFPISIEYVIYRQKKNREDFYVLGPFDTII